MRRTDLKKFLTAIALSAACGWGLRISAGPVTPPAGNAIQNSSVAQVGRYNVSSGTIRGKLTLTTAQGGIVFPDGTIQTSSAPAPSAAANSIYPATSTILAPRGINTSTMTIGSLSGVLKASGGVVTGSATTSDLTEGSNLYFTTARATSAISATSPVTALNGVIALDKSSVTLQGNTFNTGSKLVQLSGGLIPNALVDPSSVTKLGQTITLGTNTSGIYVASVTTNVSLTGGGQGAAKVITLAVDPSSGTLQGNTFNTASKLVQLDGSARLPAVDGSQLTNLTQTVAPGATYYIQNTNTAQASSAYNVSTGTTNRLNANVIVATNTTVNLLTINSLSAGVAHIATNATVFSANVDLSTEVTNNLPVAHLNSGVNADGTHFWRGDGTWAVPTATATSAIQIQQDASVVALQASTINFTGGYFNVTASPTNRANVTLTSSLPSGATAYIANAGTPSNPAFSVKSSTVDGTFNVSGAIIASNTVVTTAAGLIQNAAIDGSSVTKMGAVFNGNSQLLQLTASGLISNGLVDASSVTKQGTIQAGSNVTITPGPGILTIASSGGGFPIYPATGTIQAPLGVTQTTATVTTSIQLTGDVNGTFVSGRRNRLINGDMAIDQEHEGAAFLVGGNGNNTYGPDMWFGYTRGNSGKWITQQKNDTPPPGFTTYTHIFISSAVFSSKHDDEYVISSRIESPDIRDDGFGTANAKPITVSFWVRCSTAGAYSFAFGNNHLMGAPYHYYPATYSIVNANTWEYKSITAPGDTNTTHWSTATGTIGLKAIFDFGDGSDLQVSSSQWTNGTAAEGITGANHLISVLGSTFDVTGVQVEIGSNPTAFEFHPQDQERRRCERFYEKTYAEGVVPGTNTGNSSGSNVRNFIGGQLGATETDFYTLFNVRHYAVPTMTFYSKGGTSGKLDCFTTTGSSSEVSITGTENQGNDGIGFYQTTALDYFCSGHYVAVSRLE